MVTTRTKSGALRLAPKTKTGRLTLKSTLNSNPNHHVTRLLGLTLCLLLMSPILVAEPSPVGEPLNLNEVESGQLLLSDPRQQDLKYAAPLLHTDVDIKVTGVIARARVQQEFTNPGAEWVNGIYVFPLPETAAVDSLKMHIGERIIEGQIARKEAARKTFAKAKAEGKKASLVEQHRANLFTTRVANIAPGETVRIEITYQQTVAYDAGWFSLRFPLTLGVRYIPGHKTLRGFDGGGWAFNTNEVADASEITPPVTAGAEGHSNPVEIKVSLNAGMPLRTIKSPYHAIQQREEDSHRYIITLEHGPVPADRDFELRFQPQPQHAPRAAFFRDDYAGEQYGLLMLVPPELTWVKQHRVSREVIYVIDTSGSMQGSSLTQAKAALKYGLSRLSANDYFNVVQFNSVTSSLSPVALPATPANINAASAYIGQLHATGGTEIAGALNAVLNGQAETARMRQVVFLTDGSVGNEAALFKLIDQRLGGSRLFTVGIGSAPNSYFMREAAHVGRGTFTYVGKLDEVQQKMRSLFEKLEFPVLTDLRLEAMAGKLELATKRIADLYVHEPLMLSFKADELKRLKVSGRMLGKVWSTEVPMAGGGRENGLNKLWARQRIAAMERSLSRGADRTEVAEQIAVLGLAHHLVTAQTSLVAVDVTPTRESQASSRDARVANKMPAGWDMAVPGPRLPQTATPMLQFALRALLLLAMAGFVRVYAQRGASA